MHQEDTLTLVSTWTQINHVSCEARVAQTNAHQCSAYSNIYSNTLHKIQNACVAGIHGLHQGGARFRSLIELRLMIQIQLRQLLFILLSYLTIIYWGNMYLTSAVAVIYCVVTVKKRCVYHCGHLVTPCHQLCFTWITDFLGIKNVFIEYVRFHFTTCSLLTLTWMNNVNSHCVNHNLNTPSLKPGVTIIFTSQ